MELDNSGVVNLMLAMCERAYEDYALGGILLKRCEWGIEKGVIHVFAIDGKELDDRKKRYEINKKLHYYSTARDFFEGTKWGDYLLELGDEEIATGKRNHKRRIEDGRKEYEFIAETK